MKRLPCIVLAFFITSLFFGGCEKDDIKIRKEKLSGFVQKGPFIIGTSILMTELNSALEQTGNMFSTQISNNRGSFEFGNVTITSKFVEFSANGYYYDEVKGDISTIPLNLYALTDITDINTVNINILTHLEKRRVEYLVRQKKSFAEAKKEAQLEILAIFGFVNNLMQESETLDISVNHNDNAILLAISLILQGNRSVGDLAELLADISSDIAEDGIKDNANTLTELRNSTLQLNLQNIRQNLVARYQELGVTTSIPNFERYIADFLTHTASKPSVGNMPVNFTTTGITLNGTVNPNSSSTIVTFEYGLTTEYRSTVTANQSPVNGTTYINVSAELTDLTPGTTYHFRIKAENELGTSYGDDMTFTTYDSFTDSRDGNTYKTIKIGTQTWMAENLRYLPVVQSGYGVYGYYGSDVTEAKSQTNYTTYGVIYNWWAAINACPAGWHLSSAAEWTELVNYLGGPNGAGGKLKETGTAHWLSPNTGATNETGFTALPGGSRWYDGGFSGIRDNGYWWTATEDGTTHAWVRAIMDYNGSSISPSGNFRKELGSSVRCLRD